MTQPQIEGDFEEPLPRRPSSKEVGPELMAGLAHTVQTPLQSIIINSEMLLELLRASSDAKVREKGGRIVGRVLREAVSLQSIVRDFLALSRIAVGKKVPTDVNSLIREVVEFVRNECLSAGIDIALSLDTSIYPVLVDRSLFSHALMNLIRNARESIGTDGLIEISSRERDEFLEIEVADDGKGIPDENLEKIFEPFFSTKPGGTGLGLPIARKIVEMHNGTIFVRPEPGRGGVFVLQLPKGKFIDSPAQARKEWSVE
ncbi:MAG: hypothetical protein Kow00107_03790 [Planctomycetota bacterium]